MSYNGTTALSSVQNVPKQISDGPFVAQHNTTGISTAATRPIGAQGGRLWSYLSTDATSVVTASGYFTDAYNLGIQPGDIMFLISHTTAGSSATLAITVVHEVSSTAGAALSTASGCILST